MDALQLTIVVRFSLTCFVCVRRLPPAANVRSADSVASRTSGGADRNIGPVRSQARRWPLPWAIYIFLRRNIRRNSRGYCMKTTLCSVSSRCTQGITELLSTPAFCAAYRVRIKSTIVFTKNALLYASIIIAARFTWLESEA